MYASAIAGQKSLLYERLISAAVQILGSWFDVTVDVPIPLGQDLAPLCHVLGAISIPLLARAWRLLAAWRVVWRSEKVPGTVTHARGGASALIQAPCSRGFGLALLQP
jgi:hypothetical protein